MVCNSCPTWHEVPIETDYRLAALGTAGGLVGVPTGKTLRRLRSRLGAAFSGNARPEAQGMAGRTTPTAGLGTPVRRLNLQGNRIPARLPARRTFLA